MEIVIPIYYIITKATILHQIIRQNRVPNCYTYRRKRECYREHKDNRSNGKDAEYEQYQ